MRTCGLCSVKAHLKAYMFTCWQEGRHEGWSWSCLGGWLQYRHISVLSDGTWAKPKTTPQYPSTPQIIFVLRLVTVFFFWWFLSHWCFFFYYYFVVVISYLMLQKGLKTNSGFKWHNQHKMAIFVQWKEVALSVIFIYVSECSTSSCC